MKATSIFWFGIALVFLAHSMYQVYNLGYDSCEQKHQQWEWRQKELELDKYILERQEMAKMPKMPKAED